MLPEGSQENLNQPSQSVGPVGDHFATPAPLRGKTVADYTDGRALWEWGSKYPDEARHEITWEAKILAGLFSLSLCLAGLFLSVSESLDTNFVAIGLKFHINFKLLAIFFCGCVGGVTFSIKWLIHSAAKGKWHLDRRYWRLLVPMIGGVYACVVMTLFGSGFFAAQAAAQGQAIAQSGMPMTAALSFLVGYFSDGVSGLLSNVANAVFGTLEKK